MILATQKERTRFIRFAIVGAIGAVIDFGIFNILLSVTLIPAVWCSAVSFVAAVLSNFFWNRYWTYPDSRSKPISQQLLQFSLVSVAGLGIRVALFAIVEAPLINLSAKLLPDALLSPRFVGHNVTLAFAILIVMLWNFFANRFWTYSDVE